jgi:hypothetical protein
MIRTIPDTIDLIKNKYKRFIDVPLSWIETIGSKMSVYAWNKRWRNREQGTGYAKKPSSKIFKPASTQDDCQ